MPSGAKISLRAKCVERDAGEAFDNFAEKDKAEVGVFDLRAGLVDERLGENTREDGVRALRVLVEVAMGREAGIVQQQHARR